MLNFGEKLKVLRKASKITQKELATKLGNHQSVVSMMEKGSIVPGEEEIKQIAEALQVEAKYFNEDYDITHLIPKKPEVKKVKETPTDYSPTIKRSEFQPKTYKLQLPYYLLFEACLKVYQSDKSDLIMTLLDSNKNIKTESLKEIPVYKHKNMFSETILTKLMEKNKNVGEMKEIFKEEKISTLESYCNAIHGELPREAESLRILPDYQKFVRIYAGNEKIGITLEIAIALFVLERSQEEFELISLMYKKVVENWRKK